MDDLFRQQRAQTALEYGHGMCAAHFHETQRGVCLGMKPVQQPAAQHRIFERIGKVHVVSFLPLEVRGPQKHGTAEGRFFRALRQGRGAAGPTPRHRYA
jgi:hypothetical protein